LLRTWIELASAGREMLVVTWYLYPPLWRRVTTDRREREIVERKEEEETRPGEA
jgi:hypothetical protein